MYLHRNTVRHRLRRIVALTRVDLDDPDTRLALQLAFLSRRALARIAS
jgi:DNA-binding PucR family transcriptional regulator